MSEANRRGPSSEARTRRARKRPDRAPRGKTRDAKLALGAQNKEMGRIGQAQDNPRFRGVRPPRSPAKVGRGFGVNGNVWRI